MPDAEFGEPARHAKPKKKSQMRARREARELRNEDSSTQTFAYKVVLNLEENKLYTEICVNGPLLMEL